MRASVRLGAVLLTIVLGVAGATARPACAESDGATDGLGALVAALGSPAEAEAVQRLVARAQRADHVAVAHAARGLAYAGGPEAARGLLALLDHDDPLARSAVLGATVELGLRCERLTERVRQIARERGGPEGEAAVRALGWIGDGRDVDLLLDEARDEDPAVRVVAFRAMARLTGAAIPHDRARWEHYWSTFRRRADLMLPQTLMAITMAPAEPDTKALVELVREYGWADLPHLRTTLAAWLVADEHDLRALACILAAELRVVDLVPDLEHALRYALGQHWETEARLAVQKLGGRLPSASRRPEEPDTDAE